MREPISLPDWFFKDLLAHARRRETRHQDTGYCPILSLRIEYEQEYYLLATTCMGALLAAWIDNPERARRVGQDLIRRLFFCRKVREKAAQYGGEDDRDGGVVGRMAALDQLDNATVVL